MSVPAQGLISLDGQVPASTGELPQPSCTGIVRTHSRAGRYIPELTDPSKTRANPSVFSPSKALEPGSQRTGETLPKTDSDSSESSRPPNRCSIGRWRRSIPKSWKKSGTPQVDLGYSYDAESDIHSFNPVYDGVIEEVVDGSAKSTLVVKTENGIRMVPIYTPPEELESTFEVCDAETQTGELAMHGLAELLEVAEVEEDDISTATPGI